LLILVALIKFVLSYFVLKLEKVALKNMIKSFLI